MMEPHERKELEELKSQVNCSKRFACLDSALTDLCKSEYHKDLGILECLCATPCEFARPDASMLVCTCPLRLLIAKNFARWSAESTTVLRHEQPG